MSVKSSRFSRTAYARAADSLATELQDWASIYSRRSYRAADSLYSDKEAARFERDSDTLVDLSMQLRRIAITIRSLAS